jgi:hypothetical protein
MTRGGGLLRTATCESAAVTVKTSATSSTIRGVVRQGCRPLHDVLQQETSPHQGGAVFHALAPSLRQVVWPDKLKVGHIVKYDGSNNPEEFI